jgi:beta-glucanase (GH16 family)
MNRAEIRKIRGWLSCLMRVALITLTFSSPRSSHATAPPANDADWTLIWSDEFSGPSGSAVDPAKWTLETGGDGWGNHELEYYTARAQNSYLQDGNLVIKVLQEKFTGTDGVARDYSSARLKSQGKFSQAYGRFEARIKVPYGQGMWPAFWMLGSDIDKVGWPGSGEIDIMENVGKEPTAVHGTIHGPGYSGADGPSASYTLSDKQRFADDFHVFAVEWEPEAIRFFVDKDLYATRTLADLPKGTKWVYDHPFFLLLNVAVGGDWPGSPDASTVFPQTMLVDYVRVYQRASVGMAK